MSKAGVCRGCEAAAQGILLALGELLPVLFLGQ